jgi:hypothetical protein
MKSSVTILPASWPKYGASLASTLSSGRSVFQASHGFKAVYHLNNQNFLDATGMFPGKGYPDATGNSGMIGNGTQFSAASDDCVIISNGPTLIDLTISFWMRLG